MSEFQLSKENLEARDIAADRAAMTQRMEHYRDLQPTREQPLIVGEEAGSQVSNTGVVPEVTAAALSAAGLRSALAQHGALIVRNLFPQDEVDTLVGTIDQVLEACDSPRKVRANLVSPYFNPPSNMVSIMPDKVAELGSLRMFNSVAGGAMCVEAPVVAEALLAFYEKHGLKELITAYLGEPPCLTVKKWMLRRSKLPVEMAGWHQDGAFMGTDINSINLWIPLSDCGGDTGAPGLDVVPQRLHQVSSSDGATFDWSVSDELVNSGAFNSLPVSPVFNAGDAFFFDHLYLHRTQFREEFTKLRYAIETWFFGETTFPKSQIPIAW